MASSPRSNDLRSDATKDEAFIDPKKPKDVKTGPIWRTLFRTAKPTRTSPAMSEASSDGYVDIKAKPEKWSMGILNDKETDEVPGMSTFCFLGSKYFSVLIKSIQ